MKTIDAFWKDLKNDIATGRRPIYIRGYGRDDNKRKKIVKIYKKLFPKVEIRIDITNNHKPAHMLAKKSDYYKGKIKSRTAKTHLLNYQVSHLFGKTKNPYMFECPWNVAWVPKYLDPLTGHESKGNHRNEFQVIFEQLLKKRYKKYISDYNKIMKPLEKRLKRLLDNETNDINFKKDILKQFQKI